MKKGKLMGLLGVTLTIITGIALIGCNQPNGSTPDVTDTIQAAAIVAEPVVRDRSVRANREFTREEFSRMRPENRRLGAEERRQLAPDGVNERRGRAAYGAENPGARLPRERRTGITKEEWLQRRESRGTRSVAE